jgi:Asp/Glu/hydantoin racemase
VSEPQSERASETNRTVAQLSPPHPRLLCPRRVLADPPDDYEGMEREVLDAANQLVTNHPKVRAIVLECTNMPPFTHAVEKATGLKVWDVLSLGKWLYEGAAPRDYRKAK